MKRFSRLLVKVFAVVCLLIGSTILLANDFSLVGNRSSPNFKLVERPKTPTVLPKYERKSSNGKYLFVKAVDGGDDWRYDEDNNYYWRYDDTPATPSTFIMQPPVFQAPQYVRQFHMQPPIVFHPHQSPHFGGSFSPSFGGYSPSFGGGSYNSGGSFGSVGFRGFGGSCGPGGCR